MILRRGWWGRLIRSICRPAAVGCGKASAAGRLAAAAIAFEMLSPIEGEVIDINPEVLRDPSLAHQDPYGAGWLVAVQAPAVDGNMKNLLHGRLAQRWMEESVGALHTRISPGSEARLQDGGHAIGDVLSLVPEFQWEKFVQEMLLG